ncbi:MAG: hypothetical protein JO038_03320 [Alphaproteobacteria bacterium]|nr:hypothetical protein [Alphaproteobacteria bacterium]
MRRSGRLLGMAAAAFVLILCFGELTAPLLLLLVADAAVLVLIARGLARARALRLDIDGDPRLVLLRRTVPRLRARRPSRVIEMQVRWRHAAEALQRSRRLS